MATCPSCINATLDYLGEQEIDLPDVETWERMVRKKVDVYHCPACGHVEQVMRDRPKEEPLVGPLQTKKIINNILVTAFCLVTAIHFFTPSRWSGLGWLLLLILLLVWFALSDMWSGFSWLKNKLLAAQRRRARKKKDGDTPNPTPPAAPRLHQTDLLTRLKRALVPPVKKLAPGTVPLDVDAGLGYRLKGDQLEWVETETVRTCPHCKSATLVDMAEADQPVDPAQPRYYRCPSCSYIVREGPRVFTKSTQLKMVRVGAVFALAALLIEEFAPVPAAFAIYGLALAILLYIAYLRGE